MTKSELRSAIDQIRKEIHDIDKRNNNNIASDIFDKSVRKYQIILDIYTDIDNFGNKFPLNICNIKSNVNKKTLEDIYNIVRLALDDLYI